MWKLRVWIVVASVACLAAGVANAQGLSALGPLVTPPAAGGGFPLWVQDSAGQAVQLGTVAVDGALTTSTPVIVGDAVSEGSGFGDEGFFWAASSTATYANGDQALLVLAVEAAYGSGAPLDGQQILFGRTRLRIDAPVAGTYRVIYPYGSKVYNVATPGRRAINDTVDILGLTPNFAPMLAAPIGPLLKAVTPAPPAGYMGDPAIDQTVTGSPLNQNFFRVEGPAGSNLGGPGVDFIQTTAFQVEGKIFTPAAPGPGIPPPPLPTPLSSVSATVTATAGVGTLRVFATSVPEATVTVSGAGFATQTMVANPGGNFFANIRLANRVAIPSIVTVTATAPGLPAATVDAVPIDVITVKKANYTIRTQTLQIQAVSSNARNPRPALTVAGIGPIVAPSGLLTVRNVPVPPSTITVQSTGGGTVTVPVRVQ